jgi:hypothetical protein
MAFPRKVDPMRKRTPVHQAPHSDYVTSSGTWIEDLPETEKLQDQQLFVQFLITEDPDDGDE